MNLMMKKYLTLFGNWSLCTGKCKVKLPLKCFSCGKIGHFASKCPYAKNSDGERGWQFKTIQEVQQLQE